MYTNSFKRCNFWFCLCAPPPSNTHTGVASDCTCNIVYNLFRITSALYQLYRISQITHLLDVTAVWPSRIAYLTTPLQWIVCLITPLQVLTMSSLMVQQVGFIYLISTIVALLSQVLKDCNKLKLLVSHRQAQFWLD